jgi:PAS domain S-box-containing protein
MGAGAADVWQLPGNLEPGALQTRVRLAQHFARLQAEHLRVGGEFTLLRRALDLTGTGFVLTDPRLEDDPIVYVNEAFTRMTGYAPADVLGRNCRLLQGPDTDPAAVDELRVAVRDRRPAVVTLRNCRKDGTPFWNEVHISPVRDEHGEVVRFVGVQVDVTAAREQERLFARERAAAASAEARAAFLAAASPRLDAELDLPLTLESLARLSVPYLADVCVVHEIRHGEVHRLAASASDPVVERLVRALPTAYPVRTGDPLERVLSSRRAEIVAEVGPAMLGPAAAGSERLSAQFPGAGMVVPLRGRGRTIGVVTFASLSADRRYGDDDLLLAEELARRAALALDNARLYEDVGALARTLQEGLLPERLPEVEGVELAARFRPAAGRSIIGGDFYDVLPHAGGVDLLIGDVTGKGAQAAALTGLARHTLRTAVRYEPSPGRILDVLNRMLIADRRAGGRYCTVALCRIETNGGMRATLCCAGHPPPMLVRASGDVESVGGKGTVLGWREDARLPEVRFALEPGDALVLYTDGVTEARTSGAAYGHGGLEKLLRSAAGEDAAGIAARVDRAAARAGARRDDVAVLVGRVRPPRRVEDAR